MECAWSKLNIIIENNTAALNKILSSPWCVAKWVTSMQLNLVILMFDGNFDYYRFMIYR